MSTQPEALRLADELPRYRTVDCCNAAADELRRLHALTEQESVAADAYNHACDEMERWQHERRKAGKEVGTTGSLCDGIAWLYQHIADLEAKQGTPATGGEPVAYVEVSQSDAEVSMTWGPEPAGFNLPTGRYSLYTSPQPVREPLDTETLYEVLQTSHSKLLELAQQWADNKIHTYQFTHQAELIVNAVVRRAEAAHGIGIKGGQT